jgi:flavin reductase (DIM6/NTAB) family NADH-FMN oxidoreductase RutF
MRVDLGKKPLVYPQPVLIIGTYNDDGTPNAMNAAWGAVGDDHQIFLCLSAGHKTVKNMLRRKAFTVHIADERNMVASDFVGIVSGNNCPDKFAKSGLHAEKSAHVDAPVFTDYAICMECVLDSYEAEHCHCFGNIVNTSADESVLTNGKIDVAKLKPLTFDIDCANYVALGPIVGKAYKEGKALK